MEVPTPVPFCAMPDPWKPPHGSDVLFLLTQWDFLEVKGYALWEEVSSLSQR